MSTKTFLCVMAFLSMSRAVLAQQAATPSKITVDDTSSGQSFQASGQGEGLLDRLHISLFGIDDPQVAPVAARPDDHAPIGVMADHAHKAGEFMFGYRYQHMGMNGNLMGTESMTPAQIVTSVPNRFGGMSGMAGMSMGGKLRSAPLNMDMDMHMFEAMYAPTDWVTLMVMGSVMANDMTERVFKGDMGATSLDDSTMHSGGVGDTTVSAILPVLKNDHFQFLVNIGVSIPTGSRVESGSMLMSDGMPMNMRMPYSMQLGSGTWDVLPGATLKGREGLFGWGVQYQGTIHTGENAQGYRWGDSHMLTAWGSYEVTSWLSTSVRVVGRMSDTIHGMDPQIMSASEQSNPEFYGGQRVDALLGANVLVPKGQLKGVRFGLEAGAPFYQNLNGPQMAGQWEMMFGAQKAF